LMPDAWCELVQKFGRLFKRDILPGATSCQ
jgi:hypothetical protein